jgi:pilus assembly protein TadC
VGLDFESFTNFKSVLLGMSWFLFLFFDFKSNYSRVFRLLYQLIKLIRLCFSLLDVLISMDLVNCYMSYFLARFSFVTSLIITIFSLCLSLFISVHGNIHININY